LAERPIAPGCKPGSPDTVVRIHHGALPRGKVILLAESHDIIVFNETVRQLDEYYKAGKTPPQELLNQLNAILNESVYTE
jgi:hypothetical protein